MVSVLDIGPKVRGFKTGQSQWDFKGDITRSTLPSGGSKAACFRE
jgi:hypothetical protein